MTIWCACFTCTPNGRLYRVTYNRCHIDTINSPDDGHMAARNMYRIEINIHEKELCVKLVIYKIKSKLITFCSFVLQVVAEHFKSIQQLFHHQHIPILVHQ